MNSRTLWGIALRSKVAQFVKENGPVKRIEILKHCGQEAETQIYRMVEEGELARVSRGVYEFREVARGFNS